MNSKLPNNTELEKKFKFVTRWIFNGIFINLRSTKCVWWQKDLHKFKIRNWEFELDDSNTGSLQLICAAIETYGRIMLGYKDRNDRGFSEKSFTKFIEEFFPKIYQNKEKDIYVHYRCGLLHSYILGYNSPKGFFPTRSNGSNDRQYWDKHLWFTNSKANDVSEKGDDQHQRLIINIDTLFNDFKEAIEKFIKETEVKQLIIKAKDIIKQTGEDKFPLNMSELIIGDPKMKPAYERRKNEGVKDEDIRWWWNLQPLERHVMLQFDEFQKFDLFRKETEEGKSAEEAAMVVRKYFPFFGDSDDTSHVSGDDRLLPEELKDRINKYIEKRVSHDAEQYKKDIENSSTFNALIRKEIKEGNL